MTLKIAGLLLFVVVLLIFSRSLTVLKADGKANFEQDLNAGINDQINELDLKALEEYVSTLQGEPVKIGERIWEYICGEPIDYGNFLSQLAEVLFERVKSLLPAFSCIIAIALLCGLLSSLTDGNSVLPTIRLVAFTASFIPIIVIIGECYESARSCVLAMQNQMQILFPLLLTLMAASGGTITVAVCNPSVAFLSTTVVSIMTSVVLPTCVVTIAFSSANAVSEELKLHKFTGFFKSFNKWVIGICVSIFGIFFTLQGITGAVYDGITRRAAKYAIGTGIPIIGGFLSGGFDLAVAGSVLIKNSLGTIGIFLLVAVLFEPISILLSTNLLFRFTSAITAPLGENKISDFLGETADHLNYCTAAVLFTAFLYFLCVLLMVCSTEAFL